MNRHPVDPALVEYFYAPAAVFIIVMFTVGASFVVYRPGSPAWQMAAAAGLGVFAGAMFGGR